VLIDGDMMLRRNIDELFHIDLPPDWIACAHGCICNLDRSWWAPEGWTREACAYTGLRHPAAIISPAPPANPVEGTPYLVNSGLVVLTPSMDQMSRLESILASTDPKIAGRIATWLFPDQDFFGYAFADKWKSLPWVRPACSSPVHLGSPRLQIYNAIKISRYWHGSLWRDDQAANVHYICGKPWKEPPSVDASGDLDCGDFATPREAILDGHGCDGVTHSWWWREYYAMASGLPATSLKYVRGLVVEPSEAMRDWLLRTVDEGATML
jgi:alpha-N-acetylglucosamine transferase